MSWLLKLERYLASHKVFMDENELVRQIKAGKGDVVKFDRSVLLDIWGMLLIQEELVQKVKRLSLKYGFEWRYDEISKEFRFRA